METDQRGKVLTIIVIVIAVGVVVLAGLVYLGMRYTKGMQECADLFFTNLRERNVVAAYALTSNDFKAATSLEELKKSSSGMEKIQIEWGESQRAGRNKEQLDAFLILADGTKAPLSVTMIREDDVWKVNNVEHRRPEAKTKKEAKDEKPEKLPGYSWIINWSTARIAEAFMVKELSTEPSARTNVFSHDAEKIYCLVRVAYASDNTDVSTQWIFVGGPESKYSNHEIVTDTITTKGNDKFHFVLTRPEKGFFPKGDYIVKLFINGKKKKELGFTVK